MAYRYIGNKTRIADQIVDVVSRYVNPGQVVADPMCGTASMSAALRSKGFRVVASDILTFAVHHARVRLLLDGPPVFEGLSMEYERVLLELNGLEPVEGLFNREYGPDGFPSEGYPPRKYFSGHNARRIDAIREQLREWSPKLTLTENALLHHDLVLAANRVANIAGTYGHFRSSWSSNALGELTLRPSEFGEGPTEGHVILQGPVETLAASITADACYLDPPYMKRQYAANYHILETLARGDDPRAVGVSGLRDWWDQYSDFCSKRNISEAFSETFNNMDCPLFFISYSEDGLLSPERMGELFAEFGEVERFDFDLQRFKSNKGGLGGTVTEYLYVVRKY